jgi:hypothetical protein
MAHAIPKLKKNNRLNKIFLQSIALFIINHAVLIYLIIFHVLLTIFENMENIWLQRIEKFVDEANNRQ